MRITCDGSVTKNPGGVGGWAFVVEVPGLDPLVSSGAIPAPSTNNVAELEAIRHALLFALRCGHAEVTVRSDSRYALAAAETGRGTANRDLINSIRSVAGRLAVTWEWVRGHNGDPANEAADAAARAASRSIDRQSIDR
jgi:ribonuclease HI